MSFSQEELQRINAYWRASNYLAAGQLYSYQSLQTILRKILDTTCAVRKAFIVGDHNGKKGRRNGKTVWHGTRKALQIKDGGRLQRLWDSLRFLKIILIFV